jgi:histidine triad (HIT) family protein
MSTIFSKIIAGEIPSYKIYEDEKVYAFLDIAPETRGHTLVVPKVEVDKFYDLSEEDFVALFAAVKKLARHFDEVLGQRVFVKIIGTDVPHAHVHLVPQSDEYVAGETLKLPEEEMQEIAARLRLE